MKKTALGQRLGFTTSAFEWAGLPKILSVAKLALCFRCVLEETMSALIEYFDLQSDQKKKQKELNELTLKSFDDGKSPPATPATPSFAPVIPQYVALVLGILADPFIKSYIATKSFSMDLGAVGPLLAFSIIMGIMILPGVYKNSFAPDKPILIQLAAIFTAGVGWQTLFEAAAKSAGAA